MTFSILAYIGAALGTAAIFVLGVVAIGIVFYILNVEGVRTHKKE